MINLVSKLEIEGNLLNLIRNIYKKKKKNNLQLTSYLMLRNSLAKIKNKARMPPHHCFSTLYRSPIKKKKKES